MIKDTFALYEVPREALVIGMAGLLPYVATSLGTTILAWDINHAAPDGTGFLLSEKSAQLLLDIIEPLQIGYGAVVGILLCTVTMSELLIITDYLLPWRHPLGPRMGQIRWQSRLSPLRLRRRRARRRMAHNPYAHRIRAHHSIPVFHNVLLRRREGGYQGVGSTLVFDVSFRLDIRCRG